MMKGTRRLKKLRAGHYMDGCIPRGEVSQYVGIHLYPDSLPPFLESYHSGGWSTGVFMTREYLESAFQDLVAKVESHEK